MPPMRNITLDKPVKTERTHEENQERAYIAASRRSDRSLEARVESARRASEIHKRRTGRSLRITEQDVVNEEMYEEEDDDLPLQYRRLTAHLQTNSTDFNRRLAAYLTSQMAMRTALDQAMLNSYGPRPNGGSYMSAQPQSYLSQGVGSPISPTSPTSPNSPPSYRQSPYPIPESLLYRSNQQRSSSLAQRSASFPSHVSDQASPTHLDDHSKHNSLNQPPAHSVVYPSDERAINPGKRELNSQHNVHLTTSPPQQNTECLTSNELSNSNPLTTTLSPESQMFLPAGLISGDKIPQEMGGYNASHGFGGLTYFHPSYDGMSQTLAPGALDSGADGSLYSLTDGVLSPFSAASNFNSDTIFTDDLETNEPLFPNSPLNNGSGQNTPGDREWSSYIDTSWD